MKVVAVSDTHTKHYNVDLPDGDVLVHAGDMTAKGALGDLEHFCQWVEDNKFTTNIIIAGNHDFCFENDLQYQAEDMINDVGFYLKDSSVTVDGIKFYGTPWQPAFHDWAFNIKGERGLREKFSQIESDTDVVISHGPPYGILDEVKRSGPNEDPHVGSTSLRDVIVDIQPKAHIFGHIHEQYGQTERMGIKFINASICNLQYHPDNDPIVLEV
jgi:Icc-related predicted phosphoesterase